MGPMTVYVHVVPGWMRSLWANIQARTIGPMSLLGVSQHAEQTPGHAWKFLYLTDKRLSTHSNEHLSAVYSVQGGGTNQVWSNPCANTVKHCKRCPQFRPYWSKRSTA